MGDKIAKVSLNGQTLIDVSEDTVTPEVLARDETAHDAAGESIRGTAEFGGDTSECYKTTDPASTDIADNDYIPFNDVSDSETPKKKTLFSSIVDKLKSTFATITQLNAKQDSLGIGTNDYTFLRKDGTWKVPLLAEFKEVSSGDLNDLTEGYYVSWYGNYNNITNHPPIADAYLYYVIKVSGSDYDYMKQIAIARGTNTIYTRTKTTASTPWTDWVKIANTDDDKFIVNYGTDIPSNADLNDYKDPGTYNVKFNTTAATITNIPTNKAGKLIVMNNASYHYRTQLYIPFANTGGQLYQRSWNNENSADTWSIWEDYTKGNCYVGQCDTAADQQVKVVTVDANFVFRKGIILAVNFANTNTASNVKLKIANVEYPIRYNTAVYTGNATWITGLASVTIFYMFNGTEWVWLNVSRYQLDFSMAVTAAQIDAGTDTTSRPVRADYLKTGIRMVMNDFSDVWLCSLRMKSIDIPDNSGYPKYLLLHDVTEWFNSTTTSQKTQGFSGWIISSRQSGNLTNYICEIKALVAYQKVTSPSSTGGNGVGNLILETTHRLHKTCILKDGNDKYYLAVYCGGSGRQAVLFGRWVHDNNRNTDWTGFVGTWVNCTDSSGTLPSGYSVAIQGRADSSPLKTLHYTDGRVYGTRQDDLDNYMPVPYQIVSSSFVEDTSGAMILHIQPDGSGDNAFELKHNIGNDQLYVNRKKSGNWLGDSQIYWKYRPNIVYCTCSTAAGTAAKVATSTFGKIVELCPGMIAAVTFTNGNTASSCTLNVDNTGAKSIYYNAGVYTSTSQDICGRANTTIYYMWDGTYWRWLGVGRIIDTVDPRNLGFGIGTCDTAAATTAKLVTLASYALRTGGYVTVKFTYDVPANATLNINSQGAKPIYYRGAAITAGKIKAGDRVTFVYNGTQYELVSNDRWGKLSGCWVVSAAAQYVEKYCDGSKTASQILNELYTTLKNRWLALNSDERMEVTGCWAPNVGEMNNSRLGTFISNSTTDFAFNFNGVYNTGDSRLLSGGIKLVNNASHYYINIKSSSTDTFTNYDSQVWGSTVNFGVRYQIWKLI